LRIISSACHLEFKHQCLHHPVSAIQTRSIIIQMGWNHVIHQLKLYRRFICSEHKNKSSSGSVDGLEFIIQCQFKIETILVDISNIQTNDCIIKKIFKEHLIIICLLQTYAYLSILYITLFIKIKSKYL
jgi:hypothetical protein